MSSFGAAAGFSDSSCGSLGAITPTSSILNGSPIYVEPTPEPNPQQDDMSKIRKRGRKGHTKSRKGCFNCKRARIKCKENRPSCDYCAHRGLRCTWPEMETQVNRSQIKPNTGAPVHYANSSSSSSTSSYMVPVMPQLKVASPIFNMADFRFFHHFIDSAYPHHPIGNDSVWKHEIPIIAADHDYLLHAMLALGASELADKEVDPMTAREISCAAMSHRVQAISSLNVGISNGLTRFEQGNAMLATCFALLFQSVLLQDGLAEYMTFIRGTVSLGIQMGMRGMTILFTQLFDNKDLEMVDPYMAAAPLVDPGLVRAALQSLDKIQPLSYMGLRKIYAAFSYHMPHNEFQEFTDPSNSVCQLLQSHFLALQLTMTPITSEEKKGARGKEVDEENTTVRWFNELHRNIPEKMRTYYEWPIWVESEVKQRRIFNGVVNVEEDMGELSISTD